jgi:signal transduction histidine kinase
MDAEAQLREELNELKGRHARLQLLYQVSGVIHSTLDPQEALQLIVDEAVRLAGASSGSTVLVNPNTGFLEIHASRGLAESATGLKLLLGEGVTGWVARTGHPARVDDVAKDPRYVMIRAEVRSELAVPLEVRGEVRGVLNVDSDRANAFTAEHQELLEGLAQQSARVIQNTWLYEQMRLKVRLSESLVNVSRVINSPLTLDDALNTITREAAQLMHARMCSLMLLDESRLWLELRASHGAGHDYVNKPRLHVNESLLGAVARRQKPMRVENVQTSGRYQYRDLARREGLISLLSVPLVYASKSTGTLSVYTSEIYHFSDEEVRILAAFAELSAIAIEKARVYERLVDVEGELRHREKLSALGLLAAEVAHEIRNPLTVLKMLYHSLDLRFAPEDPRAKDARIIDEKITHLNKIVDQILDFARSTEPQFTAVNLGQLIDELGLLVRHKLKQQNIELVRRLCHDLPPVKGEATQLEQALLNLILNAAEAMPQGGVLTLTTRAVGPHRSRANPSHVAIDIQDTGQGMTEEFRRRAFRSLLQTTKSKGTGLGLAIVARVVETHHGKVKIKSRLGAGTTISIILPVEQNPAK